MKFEDVKHIGVLGGGVMGGGIAQIHAAAGFRVTIRDISDQIIEDTRQALIEGKWGVKRAVERGKMGFDTAVQVMDLVDFTTDVKDLKDCDLIIEAVPEDLELKQKVFKELDEIVKPQAIFTSNTSGIVIQEIAEPVSDARKEQFVGMHFSNPVPVMSMCEVITTPQATQETIDTVVAVAEATRRAVCMVKDTPGTRGFIPNRVFAAAAREARKIVEDGIATPEDVDKAMITGRNWPAAFFGNRGGIGKQW
ncbi:MAG: 3-hydroxyacyl-CoA dehydrogenase family protein [Pseudomonadales bacterium]|nr:3-hydroxyacyl-CoA dehydrogenase family protein [Pseudomonadales bacterium]